MSSYVVVRKACRLLRGCDLKFNKLISRSISFTFQTRTQTRASTEPLTDKKWSECIHAHVCTRNHAITESELSQLLNYKHRHYNLGTMLLVLPLPINQHFPLNLQIY